MNKGLESNSFEEAEVTRIRVATVRKDFCRLTSRPVLRGEGELNMRATHPRRCVVEENYSAAHEATTNHSSESHPARQAPCDLAGSTRKAISYLRSGHGERNRRLVFMSFIRENGWRCSFCNADRTIISRQIVFRSADKVFETARRGNGLTNEIDRLCLQRLIVTGKGGVWLNLTEEQYKSLCQR
jgi:hypothetical protein